MIKNKKEREIHLIIKKNERNQSTKKSIRIHLWWNIIICSTGGQTNSLLLMERFSSRLSAAQFQFGKLAVTYFNCKSGQQWRKWPTVGSELTCCFQVSHSRINTEVSWKTAFGVLPMCDLHLHPQWKWAAAVAANAQNKRKMPKKKNRLWQKCSELIG